MQSADVVIIGSGILGASIAYALTARGVRNVIVLEKEDMPNRHSNGRNASYYLPMYDTDAFSTLAQASFSFFKSPPDGFSETPLLVPHGAVIAATDVDQADLEAEISAARALKIGVERLNPTQVEDLVPFVRTDRFVSAAFYPEAGPIDVHALSTGYIREAKRRGARFLMNEEVLAITSKAGEAVSVVTRGETFACGFVVNAAGAWAGEIGTMAEATRFSFTPRRRHIISVALGSEYAGGQWAFFRCPSLPLYLKAETGRLLASRMDAEPDAPGDCTTDDMRVADIADTVNAYTKLSVRHIERAWAGHRTFASDDMPVIGRDPRLGSFIWAAGLGGAGVMSSPAVGKLVADAVLGHPSQATASMVSPGRQS